MSRGPFACMQLLAIAAVVLAGCDRGQIRRTLVGGATTSNREVLDTSALPPKAIYVTLVT